MVGETFDGNPSYTCGYQSVMNGILNYPLYYPLTRAFSSTSGSITDLVSMINTLRTTCGDTTLLGNFLENHDNPRFPTLTTDPALTRNAMAFTLLMDGIPIIYEGQEQHYTGGADPANREAVWLSGYSTSSPYYVFITQLNRIRNYAIWQSPSYVTSMASVIYNDTTTIATSKGAAGAQIVSVFSNKGSYGASYTQTIPNTGYRASIQLAEILSCTNVNVDGYGNIVVSMSAGAPKVSLICWALFEI